MLGVHQTELITVRGGEMVEGAMSLNTTVCHFKILTHFLSNGSKDLQNQLYRNVSTVMPNEHDSIESDSTHTSLFLVKEKTINVTRLGLSFCVLLA